MQIQYYKTAWGDIKNSKGWFGKLCLLALVGFIPIFGAIVQYGYLYGWAREAAWGVREPMPQRLFGNEDGKLYRRGWFVFVVVFVFSLIPSIVIGIGSGAQQYAFYSNAANDFSSVGVMSPVGSLLYYIGLVLGLLMSILAWIGSMRVVIYDRLSPGFQFGKIWKMFRHDTGGIMRIFGMNLLVSFIVGLVISIIVMVLFSGTIITAVSAMASSGYDMQSLQYMNDAEATAFALQFMSSAGIVGLLSMLVGGFAISLGSVFAMTLVARALGYWAAQFDVPRWRGQDDPMPFELQNGQPYRQ